MTYIPSSGGGSGVDGPPAADGYTKFLYQTTEDSTATTWVNHGSGGTLTMAQQLANGNASAGFQPGSASLFKLAAYPSYFNAVQEGGPRATLATAPSTSTAWTFDVYFKPYQTSTATGRVIWGARRTTGAVTGVTNTDWSFCIFTNGAPTAGQTDWGFAFTLGNGTSIKETASANFGGGNYYLYNNVISHIGIVVYQNGENTAYSAYLNGIPIRGSTAVASAQVLDFVNAREWLFMSGYATTPCPFGWASNAQLSNVARPTSYFIDAARRTM